MRAAREVAVRRTPPGRHAAAGSFVQMHMHMHMDMRMRMCIAHSSGAPTARTREDGCGAGRRRRHLPSTTIDVRVSWRPSGAICAPRDQENTRRRSRRLR